MRRNALWSIVAVVVLTVSALWVVPGAVRSSPVAGPHPAVRPQATDTVTPTDSFGFASYSFDTGLLSGRVYFIATDPSDPTGTVTLTDQNATRDAVSTPFASWSVTFQGGVNRSYLWNKYAELPLGLVLGGNWTITVSGTTAGTSSTNFSVRTFFAILSPGAQVYLPSHSATVYYSVNSTATDGPYGYLSSVQLVGAYQTSGGTAKLFANAISLGPATQGNYSFGVPANALTNSIAVLTLYANVSRGGQTQTQIAHTDVLVGALDAPRVYLGSCARGCISDTFLSGTPVYVSVEATISYFGFAVPAGGMTATFKFFNTQNSPVTPPGNPPATVTTNDSGGASVLFIASSTVFSTTGPSNLNVTITDPANPATPTYTKVTFFVQGASAGAVSLGVTLDNSQYYGGDTVTATWQLGSGNASLVAGWVPDAWWVWETTTGVLLWYQNLTGTQTHGTFQFKAPGSYGGQLVVGVAAHNATGSLIATASAVVSPPAIFLNPNELYYLPGDTVTVKISTAGSAFTGANLTGSVQDAFGNLVWSGTVSGGQISVAIPSVGAPTSLLFSVWAQSGSLGAFANATVSVFEFFGYTLTVGVATASSYTDGSFQPGQSISVSYALKALGGAALPKQFILAVILGGIFFFSATPYITEVQTSAASGQIGFTIPKGTPAGAQQFSVIALAGSCFYCEVVAGFSVFVNPNPGALNYELAPNTGLSVGWVVLLVLIVLVFLFAVWAARRKGSRPMLMQPAAPAAGSTWQEPPPTSSGESAPPPPSQGPAT